MEAAGFGQWLENWARQREIGFLSLQGGGRRLRGILRPEEGGGTQRRLVTFQHWEN